MEVLPSYYRLCKILQFRARIWAGWNDEKDRFIWCRLALIDVSESEWSRLYLIATKGINYKALHSRFESVWSQDLADDYSLEGADPRSDLLWELFFRSRTCHVGKPYLFVVELAGLDQVREWGRKLYVIFLLILGHPSRDLYVLGCC